MTHWIRFERSGTIRSGRLQGGVVIDCGGDLFSRPSVAGRASRLNEVKRLAPCCSGKFICVWNNCRADVAKRGLAVPDELLYLFKRRTSRAVSGDALRAPARYDGNVVLEGKWAW